MYRNAETEKAYRLGLVIGRFQIIHTGHEEIIRRAVELCDTVGVFVGSSQESGTAKNPFSYEMRKSMLTDIFGNDISVHPLPDIGAGNNCIWGEYVFQNVFDRFGEYPDLFVSGEEDRRTGWFPPDLFPELAQIFLPKSIDISASRMREYLIEDNFDSWKKYSNPCLWDRYPMLRNAAILSSDISDTSSI